MGGEWIEIYSNIILHSEGIEYFPIRIWEDGVFVYLAYCQYSGQHNSYR